MHPIAYLLISAINIFQFFLLVWIILGFLILFNVVNRYHPVVRFMNEFLTRLMEPPLRRMRRYFRPINGVDISPIILFLALNVLSYTIRYYL